MGLSDVDLARIAYACQDYAGNWYGKQPSGLIYSRWDCERYLVEGYLKQPHNSNRLAQSWDEVTAAVGAYLDAHPGILVVGRIADEVRAARQAARDEAAQALLDQAGAVFRAGQLDEAAGLLNQAEIASPDYRPRGRSFDCYRNKIAKVSYGLVDNVDRVPEDQMARPFLNSSDVARLGGVTAATVSRYLQRSKPADPESGRAAGPYVNDPFPSPDDYNGKWPWWALEREQEIRDWFARRSDRSGVGGRPPKVAGQG